MDSKSKLIAAELLHNISSAELKKLAKMYGFREFNTLRFDIAVYKIKYRTPYASGEIEVSGLLSIPVNASAALPLLSIQHPTMLLKAEAPSVRQEIAAPDFFAGMGYITMQSDYIGYGESSSYFHPYYDKAYSASCVLDVIEAVLDFLKQKEIQTNGKLFLAGYSEGGYVTLAAQRALEKNRSLPLELIAVAAGAGGYDLFGMLSDFTTGSGSHVQPSYIVFLIMAYERTYLWNKSLEYYFSKEYAALIPELMDGTHDSAYINSKLTGNLALLFNPDFYRNLTGTGEMELKKALFVNSLSDWKPLAPLRLYHGTNDEIIPFRNSEMTYSNFLEHQAGHVEFISLAAPSHAAGIQPMLASVVPWFKSFL